MMLIPAIRWAVRKNLSALKITNAFAGLKEGSSANIMRNINPEGESKLTESNVKFHSILSAAGSQQVKPYPCGKKNLARACVQACKRTHTLKLTQIPHQLRVSSQEQLFLVQCMFVRSVCVCVCVSACACDRWRKSKCMLARVREAETEGERGKKRGRERERENEGLKTCEGNDP